MNQWCWSYVTCTSALTFRSSWVIMSEKADLELQAEPSVQLIARIAANATPQSKKKKKKSLRRKVWKTIYLYECHLMAAYAHKYAIDHAREVHRARWDEVMVPDVENLVDWIKLFMVCMLTAPFVWWVLG